MEDLSVYRQTTEIPTQSMPSMSNSMLPLSIDTNFDVNRSDTILSRTLKRKFTELEEITQRLKARLFDVTGDENIDPDDEFENDLNTNPEEEEEDNDNEDAQNLQASSTAGQFDWFRQATSILAPTTTEPTLFEGRANEFQHIITASNNNYNVGVSGDAAVNQPVAERNISGCSQYTTTSIVASKQSEGCWQNILQQHELDEIINPQLLPRLLNPVVPVSTSEESTPRLLQPQQPIQIENDDELTDSDSVNSNQHTLDQDRIRLISNALQNTNIDEQMERHAPEGHVSTLKEK